MKIKLIVSVAAIAVAASTMAVSAEEPARPSEQTFHRYVTLTGIHAIPMLPDELAKVRGAHARIWTNGGPTNVNFHAKFFRTQVHGCLDVSGRGSPFPFINRANGHC